MTCWIIKYFEKPEFSFLLMEWRYSHWYLTKRSWLQGQYSCWRAAYWLALHHVSWKQYIMAIFGIVELRKNPNTNLSRWSWLWYFLSEMEQIKWGYRCRYSSAPNFLLNFNHHNYSACHYSSKRVGNVEVKSNYLQVKCLLYNGLLAN